MVFNILKKLLYRKAVFLVIYKIEKNKIKYLLLKRKLHWKGWEFSKGGKEKKETYNQTILRELKEETGIKPVKIKKHNKKGTFFYDKNTIKEKKYKGQKFKLYSVQVKPRKIALDKREHSDFKWCTYNQAIKLLTWPNQRECLKIVGKR